MKEILVQKNGSRLTSVFFIVMVVFLVRALEQFEESYVVLAEETEVLDLVLEVGDTLNTHTECVA